LDDDDDNDDDDQASNESNDLDVEFYNNDENIEYLHKENQIRIDNVLIKFN
jgi:hypothetical protein